MRALKKHHLFFIISLVFSLVVLSFACKKKSPEPVTIHLLLSNDTHGTFLPYNIMVGETQRLVGGMETVNHYLSEIRKSPREVMLMDTGDVMSGTLATQLEYKGVIGGAMMEFMNLLGYDVWCFGNHAFDKGQENAKGLERLANFPTVLTNIVYKDNGGLFTEKPYVILEKAGLKIGVIGVMEENFLIEVDKRRTVGLEVLPIVSTLNSYIPDLDKKTDLIIVLAQAKYDTGKQIAEEVPGVDVVLIADDRFGFEEINDVLIKSSLGNLRTFGSLVITVQDDRIINYKEELVWLWADIDMNPSPQISALIEEIQSSIKEEYNREIGVCEFDKTREPHPVESVLGNWITDAMRWKTGAQVAFQNSGGIRADITSGPITIADIYELSPFNNVLFVFELTGQQIKEVLECDIERGWDRLQVSGITYRHYKKDAKPEGERVDYVKVDGEVVVDKGQLLLPDKVYSVASNDYVVGQAKDKYFNFPVTESRDTGFPLNLVLVEWLEQNEVLVCEIEDRIQIIQ
ncbi:MAG: bifunctional UDP-sugar hydrolase/5'-nucleotidase [Candidatus Aminicenantaceae bacterium]